MNKVCVIKPNGNSQYCQDLQEYKSVEVPIWQLVLASHYNTDLLIDGEVNNLSNQQIVDKAINEFKAKKVVIIATGNHPSSFIQQRGEMIKLSCMFEKYKDVEIITHSKLPVNPCQYKVNWDLIDFNKYRASNWHCVDEQTEILTDQGWKFFKDLDKTEKVATLNINKNCVEYQKPNKYYNYDYDGEMYSYNGRFEDMLVTLNHKLLVSGYNNYKWKLIEANKTKKCIRFNRCFNYDKKDVNDFIFPQIDTYRLRRNVKSLLMDDFLLFLGIYLSEGSTYRNNVAISQLNKGKRKVIKQWIEKLKYRVTDNKKTPFLSISNKQLVLYFKQFGKAKDKFIPRELLNSLSKRQCRILLKALMFGDGSWDKEKIEKSGYYCSTSKQLSNDVQELALKGGYMASFVETKWHLNKGHFGKNVVYSVNICDTRKYPAVDVRTRKTEIINYKGKVYCVEVDNHIIYIRRNGKCHWTGNSMTNNLNPSPYGVNYSSVSCPHKCNYCVVKRFYGNKYIERDLEDITRDFDELAKRNVINIKMMDELFVSKPERVKKICQAIIDKGYNFNIWAYARIDIMNDEILKIMRKAGIRWLAFGVESGNDKIRKDVLKGNFTKNKIKEVIKMTKDNDICVIGNFMFGFWEDNKDTMQETLDLAIELNCEYVNFYCLTAFPETNFHNDLLSKGVPLPTSWEQYAQISEQFKALPTKYLKAEEVLRFRDRAFQIYFRESTYIDMIESKFGAKTIKHIDTMIHKRIGRLYC